MKELTLMDWVKDKVYKIVLPIYLWSIGYKTLNDYITEIEKRYELSKLNVN